MKMYLEDKSNKLYSKEEEEERENEGRKRKLQKLINSYKEEILINTKTLKAI